MIYCAAYGLKNVTVALFCESYPVLVDRQVSKIATEFPSYIGEIAERKKQHGFAFYLRKEYGGGAILLRNLDDDVDKYMSAEFALIAVDELTKNLERTFAVLRGSMRWPGIKNVRFIGATNPGGIGAHWVKSLWIDKIFPNEMLGMEDQFAFVKALPSDNPFLDDSYWDMLSHLPVQLAKAWRDGDWSSFEGQAFIEFYESVHVLDSSTFNIPSHWRKTCAIDWGYEKPFCFLWTAWDEDGTAYTYREFYGCEPGKPNKGLRMNAAEVARIAIEMENGEEIEYRVCDSACWQQTGLQNKRGEVSSVASEFQDAGLDIIKSKKDRIQGKQQIHMRLKGYEENYNEDGTPGMPTNPAWYILDTCSNLIRTLPALELDVHNIEKVATNGEDHAFDAACYQFLEATMTSPTERHDARQEQDYSHERSTKRKGWMSA